MDCALHAAADDAVPGFSRLFASIANGGAPDRMLRHGKGVDNHGFLKGLLTTLTCGLNVCMKSTIVGPEQYIIMRNLEGQTGVLGSGEHGAVFAWKLLLSDTEVRGIAEDEPIERGAFRSAAARVARLLTFAA